MPDEKYTESLLRVARTLAAVPDIERIAQEITSTALELTGALGAYVERVVGRKGSVAVIAGTGERVPATGVVAPYPGSLTQELIDSGEPLVLDSLRAIGPGTAPYLAEHCGDCAGMIVPLMSEGEIVGSMVLLRERGGPTFNDMEVGAARLLGDLASVALRRVDREAELQTRHERFVALAENAADAIVTITAEDRILFANPTALKMFGYTWEELESLPFTHMIPERFREGHREGMARYIATGKRRIAWNGVELTGLHREGWEFPVEVTFGEFTQHGERFFTGLMRDITERKRIEAERDALFHAAESARSDAEAGRVELERVLAGKSRLIRGFSHDIKNPLGAADGYAQLLLDGIMGELSEKQVDALARIRTSIAVAIGLINDVVEFSRAESGQIEVRPQPFDADVLVREIVEEHRAAATQAGMELAVAEDSAGELVCDPVRIRQILGNLLTNAIKYGGGNGRIEVSARRQPEEARVLFTVADNGPGIPPDRQHLLFEEFQRLHTGQKEGSGLGLAISRRIARVLGGDILVDSEPGRGSAFTLWIPAARH